MAQKPSILLITGWKRVVSALRGPQWVSLARLNKMGRILSVEVLNPWWSCLLGKTIPLVNISFSAFSLEDNSLTALNSGPLKKTLYAAFNSTSPYSFIHLSYQQTSCLGVLILPGWYWHRFGSSALWLFTAEVCTRMWLGWILLSLGYYIRNKLLC